MTGPVEAQLDAYNAHDIEGFLACYADDAVIRHGDGRVLMSGSEQIRDRYTQLFAAYPNVHAQVATRLQVGEWTVDEEHVGLGPDRLHVVVGYLVRSGLIRSVVMLRSDL